MKRASPNLSNGTSGDKSSGRSYADIVKNEKDGHELDVNQIMRDLKELQVNETFQIDVQSDPFILLRLLFDGHKARAASFGILKSNA